MRIVATLVVVAVLVPTALHVIVRPEPVVDDPVAVANDNRTPAGRRVRDTLELRLTVGRAAWQIFGDSSAPIHRQSG
ncbi:MAG: hypothetical protein ABI969_00665 [bacterium]